MAQRKKNRKKVAGRLNLQIPAGQASPSPPVGPALGQRGINIMGFCKAFNDHTGKEEKGVPCPVTIEYYEDKSFSFEVRTPPASYLLKKAAGVSKGMQTPGREGGKTVTMDTCRQIAERKLADLNTDDVEAGARVVAGSARSMGFSVTGA